MADNRTLSQFLIHLKSDKAGASVGSWHGFQEFLSEAIEKLKDRKDIDVGGAEYEPKEFLAFIAGLIRFKFFDGETILFRAKPDQFAKIKGLFTKLGEDISIRYQDDNTYAEAITYLERVLEVEGFETEKAEDDEKEDAAELGAKDALEKLTARVSDARSLAQEKLKPYIEKRIKGDEPTDEEKENKEDPEELAEAKKKLRTTRDETVTKYKKALDASFKQQKERLAQQNPLVFVFVSTVEDSNATFNHELLEALTLATKTLKSGLQLAQDALSAKLRAYDLLSAALSELSEYLSTFEKKHEELVNEYQPLLGVPVVTSSASQEGDGAESPERKDEEEEAPRQDVQAEREKIYRALLLRVRDIGTFAYALSPKLALEFAKALGFSGDRDPQKFISTYISDRYTALKKYLDDAAALSSEELSLVAFENALLEELRQLFTVAKAFEDRPEEQEPENVPKNIEPTQEQMQATAAAGTLGSTPATEEQRLSEKVRSISRAQHDILAMAEGELRLKMREAGLNDQQITDILDKNRTLLLDSLRYKAFEAASHLKPGEKLGPSMILGLIAEEVDVFYVKLAASNAQIAGSLGKVHHTTAESLRQQLQTLAQQNIIALNETQIAEIVSSFEKSQFQPLIQYFQDTQGYFDGGARLTKILVENHIVREDQINALKKRLFADDFAAIFEPGLNALNPAAREEAKKRINEILLRAAQGKTRPGDEAYLLSFIPYNLHASLVLEQFFASQMMADTYERMHGLHGMLTRVDKGIAGSQSFRQTSGALAAFAGPSVSEPTTPPATNYNQLSDEDKFMMQVALTIAYEQMRDATPEQRAVLQGEIAVLIHDVYSGDGVNPRLLEGGNGGALDAGVKNLAARGAAGHNPGAKEKFANFAQNAMAGGQKSPGPTERAQQLQSALKVLRTGGNPAAIAALLLTDKKAREMFLKGAAIVITTGVGGGVGLALGAINAITSIPIIGPLLGSLLGLPAVGGAAGTASGVSAGGQIASEFAKSAAGTAKNANTLLNTNIARTRPALETAARGGMNSALNTSTNVVYSTANATIAGGAVAAAILGPFSLIAFFTIITITVIGTSMNGYPGRSGFLSNYSPLIDVGGTQGCWPVAGRITDLFHARTMMLNGSLVTRLQLNETAIDIGAPNGTPIYTPFSGRATWKIQRGKSGTGTAGYGYHVYVVTEQNFKIVLGHMSAFPNGIKDGDSSSVVAGQLVGLSGNTGASTAPHLHYGVMPVSGTSAPHIHQILPVPVAQLKNGYVTSPTACGSPTAPSEDPATPPQPETL